MILITAVVARRDYDNYAGSHGVFGCLIDSIRGVGNVLIAAQRDAHDPNVEALFVLDDLSQAALDVRLSDPSVFTDLY